MKCLALSVTARIGLVLACFAFTPLEAADSAALKRLDQVSDILVTTATIAWLCSQSQNLTTDAFLAWTTRALQVEDLVPQYAEMLAPGDEAVATRTTVEFFVITGKLQEDHRQIILSDPLSHCGEDAVRLTEDIIRQAEVGLFRSSTEWAVEIIANLPRE